MIVLDTTIVNVALPVIRADLGFSEAELPWVVNAYLIAFGGLLLLAGRIGDLWSRRGVYLVGIVVFTAASVWCGLAESKGMLVAARFVQGAGGAFTNAVVLGMIVTMFPSPRGQTKAFGVYAFVAAAGGAFGLLVGGVLTQLLSWHWIFFVNLPIGIATAVAALYVVPPDRGPGLGHGATDMLGAALITGGLMLSVYTIVEPAAVHGWGAPVTLALAGASAVVIAAAVVREATAADPLVPLRIFRSRPLVVANVIQILAVAGMFGMFFLGALYVQIVLGFDPIRTGLAFLPLSVVMGLLSVCVTDRVVRRLGALRTGAVGLVLMAASLAWLSRVPADGAYVVDVLPALLLFAVGGALEYPALVSLAMRGATARESGLLSGVVNTSAQVGGALGLAVMAAVAAGRTAALRADGQTAAAALTGGYRLAFGVGAALTLVAFGIALAAMRSTAVAAAAAPGVERPGWPA